MDDEVSCCPFYIRFLSEVYHKLLSDTSGLVRGLGSQANHIPPEPIHTTRNIHNCYLLSVPTQCSVQIHLNSPQQLWFCWKTYTSVALAQSGQEQRANLINSFAELRSDSAQASSILHVVGPLMIFHIKALLYLGH